MPLLFSSLLLSLVTPAWASATGTDEMLSNIEMVPPVVVFVVDLSSDMDSPCDRSTTGNPCIEDVKSAIGSVSRHFDGVRYGVVGTSASSSGDSYFPIAPVGSSYSEIAAALTSVRTHGTTRNLAETLESVGESYLRQSSTDNETDDDGDGMTGDWSESPIGYSCTDVHLIVLTKDRPTDDDQVSFTYAMASSASTGEVSCDSSGIVTPDSQCYYDNVVANLYNSDYSTLSDTQRVVVHTVGLGLGSGTLAENLFINALENTAGDGIYDVAEDGGEILGKTLNIIAELMAGTYTRSAPVLSADGGHLIYTFYEITGINPLAQGHVRDYLLDTDPASPTFGEVLYEGPSAYGGAVWDAGIYWSVDL